MADPTNTRRRRPSRPDGAARPALAVTAQYVAYHASVQPRAVAVIDDGREISYRAFLADIGAMVSALRGLGLKAGASVGVETTHAYPQWVALLACEAIGAATLSFSRQDVDAVRATIGSLDLAVCFPGWNPPKAKRVLVMDRVWFDRLAASAPELPLTPPLVFATSPLRIVKGYGAAGTLQTMIHTGRIFEFWVRQIQLRAGFSRQSRYLVALGFTVQAFHAHATACVRMGGTCVFESNRPVSEALVAHGITHVTLLPHALAQVLDDLPIDYRKRPGLTVFTIGGSLVQPVRARVRHALADTVSESYGTNEIGVICTMDDDGTGTVLPGVRVEVIGDDGQPVLGKPGLVRVLSEGSVGGYIGDREASLRMFRDGWFYPGDIGVMKDAMTLALMGRADDLINVRGVKYPAGPLERALCAALPVDDLCVTVVAGKEGGERVCVAFVPSDANARETIPSQIGPLLPGLFGTATLVPVASIPRTADGTARRDELNRALAPLMTKG